MLIVCVESPFKPTDKEVSHYAGKYSRAELLRQNIVYARLALKHSLELGETPFASHLLYTQVWDESDALREQGIMAGTEMHTIAECVVLYEDLGISRGMCLARDHAQLAEKFVVYRRLGVSREDLAKTPLIGFPYLTRLLSEDATLSAEERTFYTKIQRA